jgi:hypothetical protein
MRNYYWPIYCSAAAAATACFTHTQLIYSWRQFSKNEDDNDEREQQWKGRLVFSSIEQALCHGNKMKLTFESTPSFRLSLSRSGTHNAKSINIHMHENEQTSLSGREEGK